MNNIINVPEVIKMVTNMIGHTPREEITVPTIQINDINYGIFGVNLWSPFLTMEDPESSHIQGVDANASHGHPLDKGAVIFIAKSPDENHIVEIVCTHDGEVISIDSE